MKKSSTITAILGPTNTGKTFYAIDRMLSYKSGMIGLPLRLLAREVYDKIIYLRGSDVVALVTGEERIVPLKPRYWVCTVEAMPRKLEVEFVAVDEIQLCADNERGHIFTSRLLSCRGKFETLFMGSGIMRNIIKSLEPDTKFLERERLSDLTHTGSKKLSRLEARTAIVGFSANDVYSVAELIRRYKGGCAVVMGALSPRTRNAQVEIYQNGDVDYLVATDAIGMGLNLSISHVAFSSLTKFDGQRVRRLRTNELAQIAGRAGRYTQSGTFGTTGDTKPFINNEIEEIRLSNFPEIKKLQWRNSELSFNSTGELIQSLELQTESPWLVRCKEMIDLESLKALVEIPSVRDRISSPLERKLLWEICQIPDFRDTSFEDHLSLLSRIFEFRIDGGRIPAEWLKNQIYRINRIDGDIDTLSKRLAFIRTWTYVSQAKDWVDEQEYWKGRSREVEDCLSDALHQALTKRFVDRRTSILLKKLKDKETLVAEVNEFGVVMIEGERIGSLDGFRFRQDKTSSSEEDKALRQAAVLALQPHILLRSEKIYLAPDAEFEISDQGEIAWHQSKVGKLQKGPDRLKPTIDVFVDKEVSVDIRLKISKRLQILIDRKITTVFEKLLDMSNDQALTGSAKGLAYQLVENLGILTRESVYDEVKNLVQDDRAKLRKHGVRFGQFTIFFPILLKPAATNLRLILSSLYLGLEKFSSPPPPGLVTIPSLPIANTNYYRNSGYRLCGDRAIRIDMLERLADLLRNKDSRQGFEADPEMLSITGTSLVQFANLLEGLGYSAEQKERLKSSDKNDSYETGKEVPSGIVEESIFIESSDVPSVNDHNPEKEVFYIFKWINLKHNKVKKDQIKKKNFDIQKKSNSYSTKKSKKFTNPKKKNLNDGIDPNNPFAAALMGLKEKK